MHAYDHVNTQLRSLLDPWKAIQMKDPEAYLYSFHHKPDGGRKISKKVRLPNSQPLHVHTFSQLISTLIQTLQ